VFIVSTRTGRKVRLERVILAQAVGTRDIFPYSILGTIQHSADILQEELTNMIDAITRFSAHSFM